MRTIKVELTIEVPSNYKIDEGMTDFAQVSNLLDEMEDRYSNVGLIEGRIIGEQNDGNDSQSQLDVDFEKEIDAYLEPIKAWQIQEAPYTSMENIARHFYELGLNTRKEK